MKITAHSKNATGSLPSLNVKLAHVTYKGSLSHPQKEGELISSWAVHHLAFSLYGFTCIYH
jgi:hypothetical protein